MKPEEHCDASSGLNRLRENTKCLWAGQEIRTVCSNPRLWAKTVNRKKRLLEGAELKVLSLCKLARRLEAGNWLPENIPGSSCLGNSLTLLLPGCMSVSGVLRSHWLACKLSQVYFGSHPPRCTSCYFVESHFMISGRPVASSVYAASSLSHMSSCCLATTFQWAKMTHLEYLCTATLYNSIASV